MKVEPLRPHLSDHCLVKSALKLNKQLLRQENKDMIHTKPNTTISWNEKSTDHLNIILGSADYQTKFSQLLTNIPEPIDSSRLVNEFTDLLLKASLNAGLKYSSHDNINKETESQNWFDAECKTEKRKLLSLGKSISKDPNNKDTRNKLFIEKKQFRKLCRRKRNIYITNRINELDFSKPKRTWKQLNLLFKTSKKRSEPPPVNITDFYKYFKKLNSKGGKTDLTNLMDENSIGPLDYQISLSEIEQAFKKLKAHKAPGHDNIRNEILISGKNHLKELIRTLFNTILASGTFPESWCIRHIVPIFKKDDRDKVENYRGITLL